MKQWLITADAPICGTTTYYRAYCEEDPLEKYPEIEEDIISELWDNYSYLLNLDDEDYPTEEDKDQTYDDAWESWRCDCSIYAEEATDEEFEMNAPGEDVDALEILIDDRENEK